MTTTVPGPCSGHGPAMADRAPQPVAAGVWAVLGLAAEAGLGFVLGPLYLFAADAFAQQPLRDPGDPNGTTGGAFLLVAVLFFFYAVVAACHVHLSGRRRWFGTAGAGSAALWWAIDLAAFVTPGLGWLARALWFS